LSDDVCLEHLHIILLGYVKAFGAARVMAPETAQSGVKRYVCGQAGCGRPAVFNIGRGDVPKSRTDVDEDARKWLTERGFKVLPPRETRKL